MHLRRLAGTRAEGPVGAMQTSHQIPKLGAGPAPRAIDGDELRIVRERFDHGVRIVPAPCLVEAQLDCANRILICLRHHWLSMSCERIAILSRNYSNSCRRCNEQGDRRACVRLGILIEENREHREAWRCEEQHVGQRRGAIPDWCRGQVLPTRWDREARRCPSYEPLLKEGKITAVRLLPRNVCTARCRE